MEFQEASLLWSRLGESVGHFTPYPLLVHFILTHKHFIECRLSPFPSFAGSFFLRLLEQVPFPERHLFDSGRWVCLKMINTRFLAISETSLSRSNRSVKAISTSGFRWWKHQVGFLAVLDDHIPSTSKKIRETMVL